MTRPLTFVLLGHPVGHSVSPAIHGAAYRALGAPHRYEVRDCPTPDHVRAAVDELRSLQLAFREASVIPDPIGQGPGEKWTGPVS